MGSLFKQKKGVRTIFFDIGGVVVDAPMAGYTKLGTQIFGCDEKTLKIATGRYLGDLERGTITSQEFWDYVSAAVSAAGGNSVPSWKFKGFWEGLLTDNLSIDRDLLEMVRRVRAHARIAVLSNVIKEHAVILQREKVYDNFNPVILSCNVGFRKPEPKMYEKAAELTKTSPAKCLLIDDCVDNLEAAQKAGWRILHYTNLDDFSRAMYSLGLLDG